MRDVSLTPSPVLFILFWQVSKSGPAFGGVSKYLLIHQPKVSKYEQIAAFGGQKWVILLSKSAAAFGGVSKHLSIYSPEVSKLITLAKPKPQGAGQGWTWVHIDVCVWLMLKLNF